MVAIPIQRRKKRFWEAEQLGSGSGLSVEAGSMAREDSMVWHVHGILLSWQSGITQKVEWPQKN
jgi:hypothetical protein